jgi:hypothetical protein
MSTHATGEPRIPEATPIPTYTVGKARLSELPEHGTSDPAHDLMSTLVKRLRDAMRRLQPSGRS